MKTFDTQNNSSENEESVKEIRGNKLRHRVLGVLFLIVGVIIIGNRLELISNYLFHLIISWQALLIGLGVSNKRSLGGIILLIVGFTFMLPKIITIPEQYDNLIFPLLLVGIGIVILVFSLGKSKPKNFRHNFDNNLLDYSDDYLNEKYFMGGADINVMSKNFKGGRVEAILGGGKINLIDAELSLEGKNVLELDLIFGGIELIVPRDWNVVLKIQSVLGGFSEKNHSVANAIDPSKELIITGKMIFGGGEIKRY